MFQGTNRTRLGGAIPILVALVLAACADTPTRPAAEADPEVDGPHARVLGLVEVTITGLGRGDQVQTYARSAASLAELDALRAADAGPAGGTTIQALIPPDNLATTGDGTIQLEPVSTGSFTDGERGAGGVRYVWATYRVRNAQTDGTAYDTERNNLTFLAVATEGTNPTLENTAISRLDRFDGSAAASSIAPAIVPTGAVGLDPAQGTVVSTAPDVLQVLDESEADAVLDGMGTEGGLTTVFPYGFVVRNPETPNSRALPESPGENEYDGLVTFAFKVPLQDTPAADPFTISAVFLAVDDDEVRVTQSLEEQDAAGQAAFEARADALLASTLTLLPGGDYGGGIDTRGFCAVRTAGSAEAPTGYLFATGDAVSISPDPYSVDAGRIGATDPITIDAGGPVLDPVGSALVVHGSQSGRASLDGGITGVGTRTLTTPANDFFPGEIVEVTLTRDLFRGSFFDCGGERVARFRVGATGGQPATFTPGEKSTFAVGSAPIFVTSGDVNNDGNLDLLVANYSSGNLTILLGDGTGNFTSTAVSPDVGSHPRFIAPGDVDADGDLDVVTANEFGSINVLLGDGTGAFTDGLETERAVGNGTYSVALGDLDADGDLDLVVANSSDNEVRIFLGDGAGNFAAPPFPLPGTVTVGNFPIHVALADFNEDGALDAVVSNQNDDTISILLGDGQGGFSQPFTPIDVGDAPHGVVVGYINPDDHLDLAVATWGSNNVTLLKGNGSGSFSAFGAVNTGVRPFFLTGGDVDGDGDLDLAVPNESSENVSVLLGDGIGGFDEDANSPLALVGSQFSTALFDMDNDDDLDLAVVGWNDDNVTVFENQ